MIFTNFSEDRMWQSNLGNLRQEGMEVAARSSSTILSFQVFALGTEGPGTT